MNRKPLKRTGLKSPTLEAIRAWQDKPRRAIPRGKRPARVGKRAKREEASWQLGRALVIERSGGFCEIPASVAGCGHVPQPHSAHHIHHILPRGRGGKHHPSNLLHVCETGHAAIHDSPRWAEHFGLLRRSGEVDSEL